MKVCTDACLLGAWVAHKMRGLNRGIKNILDIGTGTGLLALMLAQKTNAAIDAIEINKDAAQQAKENFMLSPWADKIHIHPAAIQQFAAFKKYDLIISNPPFFEDDLRSNDAHKNAAKHDTALTLQQLIDAFKQHLADDGCAFVLLPYHRTNYCKAIAANAGLFVNEILLVKQSPQHHFFRSVIMLGKQQNNCKEEIIIIHDDKRKYTAEFTHLLKDYYLKL